MQDKVNEVENLTKQLLKSIRETPLPDYSKYIEELETLKKELLEKEQMISLWKEKCEHS